MSSHPSLTSTYRARASLPTTGPLASYLLSLISVKQTNLCLSADVETSAELLQLAEDVGDSICVLKTHCDIVVDWSDRTAQALREIAKRKWFLIFEDRKFADIGGMSYWAREGYTGGAVSDTPQKPYRSNILLDTTALRSGLRSPTRTSFLAQPSSPRSRRLPMPPSPSTTRP